MENKTDLLLRLLSNYIPSERLKKSFRKKFLNNKSYKLNSGERQTGETVEAIRHDHVFRYELASQIIKNHYKNKDSFNGLDCFCGNGYGSYILAESLPVKNLLSIDGSKEAVNFAKKFYKNKKINYKHKLFPFKLNKNSFDFIVSMESIEHIKDDKAFLKTLSEALKPNGIFILSTPNEAKQSLKINPNRFHFRHYITNEMIECLKSYNLELISLYGQDVYIIDSDGICTGILNDSEMGVKENYDGQFCIYAVKKIIR